MSNVKGGFSGLVRQAQKVQKQIGKIHEEMADKEVEASVGGGAVVAVVNGKQEVVKLDISQAVLQEAAESGDASLVSELVMSAVNLAMENAQDMIQTEVDKVTGGLNVPGLF